MCLIYDLIKNGSGKSNINQSYYTKYTCKKCVNGRSDGKTDKNIEIKKD